MVKHVAENPAWAEGQTTNFGTMNLCCEHASIGAKALEQGFSHQHAQCVHRFEHHRQAASLFVVAKVASFGQL